MKSAVLFALTLALNLAMLQPSWAGAQGLMELRLTVDETTPPVKRGGELLARVITTESDLVPGQLADGHLGDLVLQNDFVRAIVTHPERGARLAGGPGALVDVVHRSFPVDGLDFIQTTADTQSSVGLVRYNRVEKIGVVGESTPTLTMSGVARPMATEPELLVSTSYELPKDESYLVVTTTFRNPSSTQSTSLLPGDLADWGVLTGFAEGLGAVANLSTRPSRVVAGIDDDVAVGFVHVDGQPLEAVVAPRLAVVQLYGRAVIPDLVLRQLDPAEAAMLRGETPPQPTYAPVPGDLGTPSGNREITLPSGGETPYVPPVSETGYGLPPGQETRVGAATDRAWEEEVPGGSEGRSLQSGTNRLILSPGQSATFVRLIAVTNRDMGRLTTLATRRAAERLGQGAGAVVGVVLDAASATPLPGADIFVSGGAGFDGTGQARPVARLTTRPDGTFAVRLPHGNYTVQATRMGNSMLAGPVLARLSTTSPLVSVPIKMSGGSATQVTVLRDGTGERLPAKVTLVAKPGSPLPFFGSSSNVTSGSKNVFYLPQGSGTFPVTPGRYEMTVSQGIEYDVVRGELTVAPDATQTVTINLAHSLEEQTKGLVSVDAGIMTSLGPAGTLDPESRVIQAVCEGVSVVVTGDYGRATDLTPTIQRLGFANRVKAFSGRRWLLRAEDMSMELFAYPLDKKTEEAMASKIDQDRASGTTPDVILADLRRDFPHVILQIDRPYDPDKGYLQSFPFDETRMTYGSANVPPPDFDAIQVVDGKRLGVQDYTMPRFHDLANRRLASGKGLLAAAGGSNSRVGAVEEIGSLRTYIRTQRDTLDRFDADTLTTSIRTGRYFLTNGPLMELQALDPRTKAFTARVGDVVDAMTSKTVVVRPVIHAAPWVGVNVISVYVDGTIADRTEVMPTTRSTRYPVQADPNSANKVRYLDGDGVVMASTLAPRRVLSPVYSALNPILGGDVVPWAFSGPILADFDLDGKVIPSSKPD